MHQTDHWSTPNELYKTYINHGWKDPCPLHATFDCLKIEYKREKLFINPPYSNLKNFIPWIIKQLKNKCKIDLLVPARTDTKWFHELFPYIKNITFIKGRLKFNDQKNGAPFPSIIIHLY